jgi:Mn2+/Fe2+ NRAMP family transporter
VSPGAAQPTEDGRGRRILVKRAEQLAREADHRLVWLNAARNLYLGMGFSNLIRLFIIISTAATLHAHGITDIQTSSDAAEALWPIAGAFTFAVFAAGIIGIGLLA